jgi:Flp pilus assembly pilin Flp
MRERWNRSMSVTEWFALAGENWRREEGQTMAEYGVVLATITIGVVLAIAALSGGIANSINKVTGLFS